MVYIFATDDTIDRLVKRVCAPLFATGLLLEGGHDESATSATVTFVQYESRVYAVTCHHVLSAFFSAAVRTGRRIAPSVHSGKAIHQFGGFDTQGQYLWNFHSCRAFPAATDIDDDAALADLDRANADRPDIAIADLTDLWPVFRATRGAEVINLDEWTEPDWSTAQPVWVAYGFPDEHKHRAGDKVAAPMPRVSARLESSLPSIEKPTYILCSTLEADHGWGFSGMSGGPVLVAHATDERFAFVGITFEGAPSSIDLQKTPEAFVGKSDIVLRGYHLIPQQFAAWLSQRKYGVALPPRR